MEVCGDCKRESDSAGPAAGQGPDTLGPFHSTLVTPSSPIPVPSKPHLPKEFGQKGKPSLGLWWHLGGPRRMSRQRKRLGGTDVHSAVTWLHACSWREPGVDEPHCHRLAESHPTGRRVTEISFPAVIFKAKCHPQNRVLRMHSRCLPTLPRGLGPLRLPPRTKLPLHRWDVSSGWLVTQQSSLQFK